MLEPKMMTKPLKKVERICLASSSLLPQNIYVILAKDVDDEPHYYVMFSDEFHSWTICWALFKDVYHEGSTDLTDLPSVGNFRELVGDGLIKIIEELHVEKD